MQFCFRNPAILSLLDEAIRSCPCRKNHTLETTACVIDENAAAMLGEFLADYRKVVVFCDENTRKYAEKLPFYQKDLCMVFPGDSHATEVRTAEGDGFIRAQNPDILVACGSGSLHDITRYCANSAGLPFVSYPTAASVDGYMSGIAAMTWHGQKLSFASTPPKAVFADPRISAEAPARLTASGVGDVLGKYTSLFDWHLSHLLTGEYECPTIVALTEAALEGVLDALQNRDLITNLEYTARVLEALLVSGLAMQLTGNSRPASAAEHHMSHLWEMAVINGKTDALHGEQVAVGTLAVMDAYSAALEAGLDWEAILHPDFDRIFDHARLETVFGTMTDGILKENMPAGGADSSSLAKIRVSDPAEAEKAVRALFAVLPAAEELRALAKAAGCMTTAAEAGLPADGTFLERSLLYAPYVRDRLTLLKILSACRMTREA